MNPSRLNARLFHRPTYVLATAVDEDWLHTDGFKKEHICQKCSHLVRIFQSAPAEFDDDVAAPELANPAQCLDQDASLPDRLVHDELLEIVRKNLQL